jgi:hypothetical protein
MFIIQVHSRFYQPLYVFYFQLPEVLMRFIIFTVVQPRLVCRLGKLFFSQTLICIILFIAYQNQGYRRRMS